MKKFLWLYSMLFLLVLCSNSYSFSVILPEGPLNIKLNTYSAGTDYSNYTDPNNPAYSGGVFTGFNRDGGGSGGTNTYGLLSLTSIQAYNSSTQSWYSVWNQSSDEWIVGYFWGLSDDELYEETIGGVVTGYHYNEIGGEMNLFKSTTGLNLSTGPLPVPDYDGLDDSEMPDWTNWNGTGDGELWLSADFTPGTIYGDTDTTYSESLDVLNMPASGSADGYLNVTGGTAKKVFDSDGFTTAIGTTADLDMNVNITGNRTNSGWNIGEDPINANAVPEPSAILLFGLGLLGFAGVVRKKKL